MIGHYEGYQAKVDQFRKDTEYEFSREKEELRKKMASINERNDRLEDKWCEQVDAKFESQNRKIKNALAEDDKKICKLQKEMIQKMEDDDSYYKREISVVFNLLERLDEDCISLEKKQQNVDVQSIREDDQKNVNKLRTECKANFKKLSRDTKGCTTSYNEANVNIKESIRKDYENMKKLVTEMEQKINKTMIMLKSDSNESKLEAN